MSNALMFNVSASAAPSNEFLTNLWDNIPWAKVENYVTRVQQRIYHAESIGNKRKVRDLQRLLLRSEAALLLAIRQVTQINKGKRTAGVDGFKTLNAAERGKLFLKLKGYSLLEHKPKPARRTYIPKDKQKKKLRPLGIPVIIDRVFQHVAKLALEPQWEVRFEPTSYGFRPKRGCHDAIEAIWTKTNGGSKRQWIFEGDFKGCFDNLNHDHIMEQIKDFPAKKVILQWLKAGFVDNNVFQHTDTGTPQGGIISPLLANIALHGMEEELGIKYKVLKKKDGPVPYVASSHSVVRYADDFVIICETKDEATSMYDKLIPYLTKRGLQLAPEKTGVVHISEGFDFLGFNIRAYFSNKTKPGKWKTLIKPSMKGIDKAKDRMRETFEIHRGSGIKLLIAELNSVIRGYANYWCTVVSKRIFVSMDNFIWNNTLRHLKRRHPRKTTGWIIKRYCQSDRTGQSNDRLLFTDPVDPNYQLIRMAWKQISRHTQIKYKNSPFDTSLKDYYHKRDIKVFERESIESKQKLAKIQNYLCPLCGTSIVNGQEGLEIHHKQPRFHGGSNEYRNLSLVHISCHIEHHKVFPAKGDVPTKAQLLAHKGRLGRLRSSV